MSRLKRKVSKVIRNAAARAAGMKSIAPTPDFGPNLTVSAFEAVIGDAREKQANYNTKLSEADEAKNVFEAAEASVADFSDRMLAAAAARFGRSSNEYVKAGGTRRVDRKHPAEAAQPVEAIKAA